MCANRNPVDDLQRLKQQILPHSWMNRPLLGHFEAEIAASKLWPVADKARLDQSTAPFECKALQIIHIPPLPRRAKLAMNSCRAKAFRVIHRLISPSSSRRNVGFASILHSLVPSFPIENSVAPLFLLLTPLPQLLRIDLTPFPLQPPFFEPLLLVR